MLDGTHPHQQSLPPLLQVDSVKQELKDALASSSKELYKQILKTGAGWVRQFVG